MAKEDNSEEYKILFSKKKEKIININDPEEGVFNDLEAAQKVYSLYSHWVCCNGDLYVFDDEAGLWTDREEVIFKIIGRYNEHLYLLNINKFGEVKRTNKGYGNSTGLKRSMIPELKTLCINNDWITQNQFSSIGKLLYLNGIYDMKTGIFNEGFNPKVVFYYKIYRTYDESNNDYIKDILNRCIYNQLGEEVGNYFLLNISRGIAGDMMKRILFGLGETNSGKSTIVKACVNTFGDYRFF